MRVERENEEYRRRAVVYPFAGSNAGQIQVEKTRTRPLVGPWRSWGPVRVSWDGFTGLSPKEAHDFGSALVEAARLAAEIEAEG